MSRLIIAVLVTACGQSHIEEEMPGDAGVAMADASASCVAERCNARDDDCDGLVDEGVSSAHFIDLDGDGYGDDATLQTGCPGPGLSERGGDCDDARSDVWPGAAELCEDGVDYDCDGLSGCADDGCACGPPEAPAGGFQMGSPPAEEGREDDEVLHPVSLTHAFVMMATEVTQAEWRELTGTSPSFHVECGELCPVERVSWYEALRYANLRSEAEGRTPCYELTHCTGTLGGGCPESPWGACAGDYECTVRWVGFECDGWRLPTEAEWEYAARAGTHTAHPAGDELGRATEVGWCQSNSEGTLHPVGLLPANAWGLFDVVGNVYEWVWDRYGPYETSREQVDPVGFSSGTLRAMRGGTFALPLRLCRTANRGSRRPEWRDALLGLRLVRTVAP